MTFEQYIVEIKKEFSKLGVPEAGECHPDCWKDSYNDGDSPKDAVATEMSYWGD